MSLVRETEAVGDWRQARHDRRLRQRRLPHGLREDVARVRRDDFGEAILDLIQERVRVEAEKLDGMTTVRCEFGPRQVVMPVVERQVLRVLNQDQTFRGWVRNEIAQLLRTEHLARTDPAGLQEIPWVHGPAPQPQDQVLRLRSSIGLKTAQYLEAEPEQWCHYVVERVIESHQADDREVTMDHSVVLLLAIGAGAGGIAKTVAALEAQSVVEVQEIDQVLPESTAVPCVSGSREGLEHTEYDAIVIVLPSPAVGAAANHRRIYRGDQGRGFDLSALGPKKWTRAVECWLDAAREPLAQDGQLLALVPASIRHGGGYTPAPELLQGFLRHATAIGLQVIEINRVIEVQPVNQPFVGRNRPERWSLLLRHDRHRSGQAITGA